MSTLLLGEEDDDGFDQHVMDETRYGREKGNFIE